MRSVEVRVGDGHVYVVVVDEAKDVIVFGQDAAEAFLKEPAISVSTLSDTERLDRVEDVLARALDAVRDNRARRFVGRRVRQKYNVTRAEDGSETFDYYDGLVKDAGWSDDLQWYTLDILYDMDGDMEHGVHVADYIEFLDEAAQG